MAVYRSFSSNDKRCATCGNWAGPREFTATRREVRVEPQDSYGPCYARHGASYQGTPCDGGNGCRDYQKWAPLM